MAFSRKELKDLPDDLRKAAMAQLKDGEPLTKERQLIRSGGFREKKGRYQKVRTWSELWKRWFDSGLECKFADEVLWPRWKAGDLKNIDFQVKVVLVSGRPGVTWKVDFAYDCGYWGERVHAEFKGAETDDYKLKRRLWEIMGPTRLLVFKQLRGDFECVENLVPGEQKRRKGKRHAKR